MIFHKFTLYDCEDPEIYAAGPILDWQKSEMGDWVMANTTEKPVFHITLDTNSLGYQVVITGKLDPEAETFFRLKYQ